MRIGMVCPYSFDYPGGVQSHILDLAHILTERGHEVRILGPGSGPASGQITEPLPDYVTLGGRAVPVKYNGSVARISCGPGTFRAVRKFLRDSDFDVLHIHEPNAPSYSLVALLLASEPVVATYHASATSSRTLRAVRPVLRPALEKIQAGISVSEMSRRWQVEQLGGDPLLIPNGVETDRFRTARAAAGCRAGDVEREDGSAHIVFLGRYDEPRKGLPILLDALSLMDETPRVTVIGGGSSTPAAVKGNVEFVGRVSEEEKARILASADIYVAPNTGGESFGIVLVEAMAAGCAVVASDIEAFADVCGAETETPAGALFPVGDSHALAETLQRLIRNDDERAALAAAGTARARLYDWNEVANQIEAVYEAVAGRKDQSE